MNTIIPSGPSRPGAAVARRAGDGPAGGALRVTALVLLMTGLPPGASAQTPAQGIGAPTGRAIYGTPVVSSTRELGTPTAVLSAPAGVVVVQHGAWGQAQHGGAAWGQLPPPGVTRIVPNVVPGWGGQPAPAYGAPGAQQAPLWGPPWVPPPNVVVLPPGTILPPGFQLPPGVIVAPGVIPGQVQPGFSPR